MKKLLKGVLLIAMVFITNSCSNDNLTDTSTTDTSTTDTSTTSTDTTDATDVTDTSTTSTDTTTDSSDVSYTYSTIETDVLDLINAHRVDLGLQSLEKIDYISYKAEEHTNYMIENNTLSHDNFTSRSEDLMSVLGATKVGENVAYNYNSTADAVFTAWLNSSSHKANIEGDYTNFGISIREDSNGKMYYTNIFVKI
jgi:uncharacterized protein YkwD